MIDIEANRGSQKYRNGEIWRRVGWMLASQVFSATPRTCFITRSQLLRLFGADVAAHVHVYNTSRIYMPWNVSIGSWSAIGEGAFIYSLGRVTIGERATISHEAHLCAGTHDYTKPDLPLLKLPIAIGDQAWICADAFVGPGVTIGEGAVVGARAVVVKDVEPWTVVAGNPARFIKKRVMSHR